ncbi:MAG: S41 family peptidase [Planctomycetota bacterium]|nr:S41 family peptidase [Planctomycetota bacterium]
MKQMVNRVGLVVFFACAGLLALRPVTPARALDRDLIATPTPVLVPGQGGSIDQLKTDAFKALRNGDFDRSNDLLAQAAAVSNDPQVQQMAHWAYSFDQQEKGVNSERHKQFEKAVADAHLLLDHKMDTYAADELARAYLLCDTKDSFRHEKWVNDLVHEASTTADQSEDSEQWLKAQRLYVDLGTLEPSNPEWKDKLKLTTRRIRLIFDYTPLRLRKLAESESKDRTGADQLLRPTTQPTTQPLADGAATTQPVTQPVADAAATTQPTTQPLANSGATTRPWLIRPITTEQSQPLITLHTPTTDPVDENASVDDTFNVSWQDASKGIEYDMLWDALVLAEQQYYREATFQNLLEGGITGLRAVVTTKGLDEAFPGLADKAKSQQFLLALDGCLADAAKATADNSQDILNQSLDKLRDLNKTTINLPEAVFVKEFADGAFNQLDPFSTMIWPNDLDEFTKSTQGEFGGVGIQIQSEDGNLKVVSPLEGTPAYKAGIKAGDVITRINGKNAKGISLDRAVKTIMGVPGTSVTLTVRSPNNNIKDYEIKREIIKVATINGYSHKPGGGWDWFVDPDQHIAYIRLTNFTKNTADDLAKALDDLKDQNARAIVLDLRYNPGGLLQSATEVVNKFVPKGVIVSTHADRPTVNPPTEIDARPDEVQSDLPMIVLVNQYSASASEIVSGALKDHQRALIVGERTYGKGSVQMLLSLDTKRAYLKLTTAHYYLPNGKCIHREEDSTTWGVDPDVTIPLTPEQMQDAITARQQMDVLRDVDDAPATMPSTEPAKKDMLSADPQLSAALLILRLELSGAQI